MQFTEFDTIYPLTVQALKNSSKANKLAHSYLLHSGSGRVRDDFPHYLAALRVCEDKKTDGTPCGMCDMCRRIKKETYPELYHVYPEGKAWQIKIGDNLNPKENTIRHFENLFYLTGTSGFTHKIGIIHDADRMNTQAQNAFLKTLEEPPKNTMFILTTANPQALLPTTRSRCQLLFLPENRCVFSFTGASELFKALFVLQTQAAGNFPLAANCAENIIAVSKNLEESTTENLREKWQQKFSYAAEQGNAASKQLEELFSSAARGEYLKQRKLFESAIHTYFAQSYLLNIENSPKVKLTNPEIFDSLELQSITRCTEPQSLKHLEAAEQLLYNLRFNINEKLAIRSFCLKLAFYQ